MKKIFQGAAKLIKEIGVTGDKLTTSRDEKNKAANERLSIDSLNDNWLSKSIRPLVLLLFTLLFFATIFLKIELSADQGEIMKIVFRFAIPFYFGGRLVEKLLKRK